jgi:hypothetical protein
MDEDKGMKLLTDPARGNNVRYLYADGVHEGEIIYVKKSDGYVIVTHPGLVQVTVSIADLYEPTNPNMP